MKDKRKKVYDPFLAVALTKQMEIIYMRAADKPVKKSTVVKRKKK